MPQPAHQGIHGSAPSSLRGILFQPFSEGSI
jgi:hypothetical protein